MADWLIHKAVIAAILFCCSIPFIGRLRPCYQAKLVGVSSYQLTVEATGGSMREPHTTADSPTMARVGRWGAGDDLLVCNNIITNRVKQESAECGDFGCLSLWP